MCGIGFVSGGGGHLTLLEQYPLIFNVAPKGKFDLISIKPGAHARLR
jgi:hypothetical protein